MSPSSRAVTTGPRGAQSGFTLVEIVVATALLGVIATTVLGGLLYGMTEARRGRLRAEAVAWVQAELDYLRLQGYPLLEATERTLTQTSGYTTYGDVAEPRIPAGFDRAVVHAEDHPILPLRKLTVVLYETPIGFFPHRG